VIGYIVAKADIVQPADPRIPDRIHMIIIEQVGSADLDQGVIELRHLHADLRIQCPKSRRLPVIKDD
jgi:hypothetical protein